MFPGINEPYRTMKLKANSFELDGAKKSILIKLRSDFPLRYDQLKSYQFQRNVIVDKNAKCEAVASETKPNVEKLKQVDLI